MPSANEAVAEGYFNDLSQQLPDQGGQSQQPKSKRVACVLCRKRKLRCDGARPACSTCTRLSHNCAYDEVRKKSGPKRGYVKELEARLAQVETLLKTHDGLEMPLNAVDLPLGNSDSLPDFGGIDPNEERLMEMRMGYSAEDTYPTMTTTSAPILNTAPTIDPSTFAPDMSWTPDQPLLATGLDEPLPPPEVCAELTALFFERAHPSAPLLHRPRFLAAMQHTSPVLRPPLCLQYAVWTLAASSHPKYAEMVDYLYRRARHYLERDEMFGVGEKMLSLATVQAWQCIAAFEFKMMYFPRAWLSTGRASRLGLMMGLHRVDGPNIDVKQCLPPPKDWIEKEERRRLFWLTFAGDRYASIGTGWPMSIDEADISTDLPASDEAFDSGIPEPTVSLNEALEPGGAEGLSSMGAVGLIAALFGRNLLHLHRQGPDQSDGDINSEFWKRHRKMDGTILNLLLGLPEALRLPHAAHDPKVVFMNMCIHTSVICLHQAAIFKVEKHKLSAKLATESKMRCLTAAAEISSLMKMTSHMDMAQANPFMAFTLYVAARVFVQYLKSRPRDDTAKASLHFLLSVLQAMKKTNPLAESFIAQLDVDLEVAGLEDLRSLRVRASRMAHAQKVQTANCPYADPEDGEPRRVPTFGDAGLAQHSNPHSTRNIVHPNVANFSSEIQEIMKTHKGEFKGIFPVRINLSSENSSTTNTSPQTLGSSEADAMELCGNNSSNNNDSTPPNPTLSPPTDLSPSSSSQSVANATSIYRQPSINWSTQTTPPTQQFTAPQQQQQQQQRQHPPPMSHMLPNFSGFSASEFLELDKQVDTTTVLDLGAVDENQLFQLSDVEWGQVLGGFENEQNQNQNQNQGFQWQGGVRSAFGS